VACGNGVVEAGEACDDGGIISGDGCSSTCAVEPGWICTGQPSACGATSVCGDGVLEGGEECDDGNAVAGDGCSPACTFDGLFATPGSVLVTEVLANPGVVSDAAGEWIELYNATLETLELAGCRIGDNAGGFTIPALAIAPGEYAVAGINGDPLLNGGVTLDLVYTGVFLSNSADHVTLSCGSTVLSSVSWDVIDVPVNGVARQQDPGTFGADPGTWCNATMPFGAGDLGTPGAANVVCAAP
jgi:cysteine-rich repeat protein